MRNVSYAEALCALNNLAYDAAKACPTEEEKRLLRQICFQLDALVDALPPLSDLAVQVFAVADAERQRVLEKLGGEVPALQSALIQGARI